LEVDHGINCECGETFSQPEKLKEHIAVQQVLEEVKRISGERFHQIAQRWEDDAHSGDLHEFIANHDLELIPENATRIAKEKIKHIVNHFDEYCLPDSETHAECRKEVEPSP